MSSPPEKIFIVPYRNRTQQKFFFAKYMTFLLENVKNYELYFSHQYDTRTFNRGAVKNIGFLAMKQKYPNDYKNITFIFNDVDTVPFTKLFDYETTPNVIKHYYGTTETLGGIVVIKGADFEKINGYPCYWGWGLEDNVLNKRAIGYGLTIDREVTFYPIGSPQILQLFDGMNRIISRKDPYRMDTDNGKDGLTTITDLSFIIDDVSLNPNDNVFVVENPAFKYINIVAFKTLVSFETDDYYNYDLREPKRQIINPSKMAKTRNYVSPSSGWNNIPYYPTTKENVINALKQSLASNTPPTPETQKLIQEYLTPVEIKEIIASVHYYQSQSSHNHHPPPPPQSATYKYSREYANHVGQKPRAQIKSPFMFGRMH